MPDPLEELRKNILTLQPVGADGFEGLMAAVLGDLTKRSFALANAGSQHGKDGQSALDSAAVVFEAKRYDGPVPKDKVYSKIFEIGADKTSTTELYILAATCPIPAQQIITLRDGAQKCSMALIVLAWPENGLAELAVLLAMTPDVSAKFIAKHTSVSETELAGQLAAVQAHPQFQPRSDELLAVLQQPSIAPAFALQDNIAWLSKAFSDQRRARAVFGQALSPEDTSISGTIDRTDLRATVASKVFGKPDGAVIGILGADGNGKSWIFAQAWSHQSGRPLTVVIVPNDINDPASPEYCQDLLISKLLTQTGETRKIEAKERWLRHFERWENETDRPSHRAYVRALKEAVRAVRRAEENDTLSPEDRLANADDTLKRNAAAAQAWRPYRGALRPDPRNEGSFVNPVDPVEWFSVDRLPGHGYEKWVSTMAGVCLTLGLLFTFVGLSAALFKVGDAVSNTNELRSAISEILRISSAKFITSMAGIVAYMIWTVVARL